MPPDLSVVVTTPDDYQTIRKTVRHLAAQTARDLLELVIVAPSADQLALDETEVAGFFQCRIVPVGKVKSVAQAHAAGLRQARAAVVAFVEEHSYPDPGWAAALIQAHRQPWAAVGPVMRNANPDSAVSWADFLLAYGPWLDPTPDETTVGADLAPTHLPGHNSSYKRALLLDYGPELEAMLVSESVLHWDLRARGYQLYLETAAKTAHLNFERLSSWIPALFYSGRLFAATRAREWAPLRRFLYVGGAPLIPMLRLRRIWRQIRRSGQQPHLPSGTWRALALGLIVSAVGEMVGYGFGAGQAEQQMARFEFHRHLYLV